jgi:hypothetical protein
MFSRIRIRTGRIEVFDALNKIAAKNIVEYRYEFLVDKLEQNIAPKWPSVGP